MIGRRSFRLKVIATAALVLAAADAPALAQSLAPPVPPATVTGVKVPIPRLRPKPPGQALPATRPAGTGTQVAATTPVAVTPAVGPPPTPGFQVNPRSKFSASQQLDLVRITAYFNSFRTMEGKFVQIGPKGEQSEGTFNLSRPGNIRFHYSPPSKLDVIADGRSVAIRDGATATQDIYPLSKTPLRYLLGETINLADENVVDSVREDPDLISVLIIEKSAFVDGKLVMIFDRKSYQLRQWIVTDPQGLNTSVAIYNTTTDKPQDARQFVISSAF